MIRPLYPGGKAKACNFSYDDGVKEDIRLVALLNQYGLKATFNLNSVLMQQQFQWVHPCGLVVQRLTTQEVSGLYDGHEVASHTCTHPYMDHFSREQMLWELGQDRANLQQLFGHSIAGYATPFHFYNDTLAQCVQEAGFSYGRISETDPSYSPWRDRYRWKPGIFHLDDGLESYVEGFLRTQEPLALCQIVGHSYDLEAEDRWAQMEALFRRLGQQENVWHCTHLQLITYLQALQQLRCEDGQLENPSGQTLWLNVMEQTIALSPGETITL